MRKNIPQHVVVHTVKLTDPSSCQAIQQLYASYVEETLAALPCPPEKKTEILQQLIQQIKRALHQEIS